MWIVAEPPVPPARAGSAAAQTVTALRIIAQAGFAAGHLVLTVCGMEMSVRWIVVETAKSFVAKARAVIFRRSALQVSSSVVFVVLGNAMMASLVTGNPISIAGARSVVDVRSAPAVPRTPDALASNV